MIPLTVTPWSGAHCNFIFWNLTALKDLSFCVCIQILSIYQNNVAFLPWGDAWIWKPFRNPSTWIVSELLTHRERSCDAEGDTRWRNAWNKSCKSARKKMFWEALFSAKGHRLFLLLLFFLFVYCFLGKPVYVYAFVICYLLFFLFVFVFWTLVLSLHFIIRYETGFYKPTPF